MLHGTINEQGNCLDVRDDISEKNTFFDIFHMFSHKSLASGALILGNISLLLTSPWACVTGVMYNLFITYFLMHTILK